jgi:hypothetical protein
LQLLLKNGVFDALKPEHTSFFTKILDYGELLIQRTRQPIRLLAALEVLLGLLSFEKPINTKAVASILLMIGHPYPIVRSRSAQELYTATLTYEDAVLPEDEEKGDEAVGILIETAWADMDHESAMEIRDKLYPLLGVEKNETLSFALAEKGNKLIKGMDAWGNVLGDRENETPYGTFASLVREHHR